MHTKLSKAPIICAIAQIKFSNIRDMESYVPKFQDAIRSSFPEYREEKKHLIKIDQASQMATTEQTNQWYFINSKKLVTISLDTQSLSVFTTQYKDFAQLLTIVNTVADNLFKNVKDIFVERVGVRFVNLIKEDDLNIIPATLRGLTIFQDLFFNEVTSTKFDNTNKTITKVRVASGKMEETGFIPSELVGSLKMLSYDFKNPLLKNSLTLEIDSVKDKQEPFRWVELKKDFESLHDKSYKIFCDTVGREALKKWK